jgi:hypothetical protein
MSTDILDELVTSIFRTEGKPSAYCLLHVGLLLGILFNPEDRGNKFL